MAVRVDYLARETGHNLVRNAMLTVAAILTVAVSLGMLSAVMLLGYGINNAFARWNDDVSFIVYANAEATPEQIASLRTQLKDNPQIASVKYLDKNASYKEFQRLFPDDPTITDTVTKDQLPTSFRVKPTNPNADVVKGLADEFKAKPGVYKVDFVADAVRLVQNASEKLTNFALIGAIALLIASLLLIFNAIQTAVFSRRREIEVMKLVGATNWFIRIPFILEGLIQGLAGAAIAAGIAKVFEWAWFDSFTGRTTETLFDSIRWTGGEFRLTVLLLFAIGALVGGVGSAASVTWYLRD
jgi:cell division transport system permease protein